ncbi:YggS family pyridoxal phosphate-dependent enzyme [Rhodospirillaceae bacterium SYSU D60014]|uniref:YggS family pyridoxal phosphate-dependent enzyme n=1 Tax=Virgifigura deserti TaxID=2268457 RepID=UPI000E663BDA
MISPAPSSTDIAGRLGDIQARIAAAARAVGRAPDSVTLVAVGKTHPAEAILAAMDVGQRVFGENRVQEAQRKWPPLRARCPDSRLHLIGPLQTNKVADALALFDVIETVDRPKLARALGAAMAKSDCRPACYIQVNTGEEPQKAGILPAEADGFIALCRDEIGLPVQGLMCIPPIAEEPAPHFALLAEIARRHDLPVLSMGMSGDFETAVRLGATHVRIGTAIFGERPPQS